jgi:hypothetical protein
MKNGSIISLRSLREIQRSRIPERIQGRTSECIEEPAALRIASPQDSTHNGQGRGFIVRLGPGYF